MLMRTMKAATLLLLAVLLPVATVHAQTGTIEGTVLDAGTDAPIPGANVVVEGTQIGASTDAEGRYSIAVEPGTYSLQASFVGFSTQEFDAVEVQSGTTTTVDFRLEAAAVGLDEIVAIGYGTQRRQDLTGSVSSISEEELERSNPVQVEEALQGRVSGVQVTSANRAVPGAGLVVRIRGNGSIGAGNSPLYVIDGVPVTGGLNTISPNNIESIEVLKDASATAIYGARGSNGVVLITTKGGEVGTTSVEFNASYGVQNVRKSYDVLGGEGYARYINDVFTLNGQEAPFENPEQYGEGTNWQDEIYQSAPLQNYQLSFRGGTESTTYSVSGSYLSEDGVVRGSSFDRGSFRVNLNGDLSDRLTLGTNLTISRALQKGATTIGSAATYTPLVPVRNEEGEYVINSDIDVLSFQNPSNNPLALLIEPTRRTETTRGLGNVFAELELIENLSLKTSLGVDYRETRDENYTPLSSGLTNAVNSAGIEDDQNVSWLVENTLSYQGTFAERHRLDAVAGYTVQKVTAEALSASAREFLSDYFRYNNLGVAADPRPPGSATADYSLESYLGRVNYTLDDKYLFTLTGRIDGSSRFGEGNKYGFFPSGAIGWRLSEEPFVQDLGVFSNLKLRVSYGVTGNQEIGNYLALASYGPSNYDFGGQLVKGIGPRGLANPDLKWERSEQVDVGVDAGIFEDRLTLTADYYYKKTNDLLLGVNLPLTTGFGSATKNIGSVLNSGLELALGVNNAWGDLNWNASANFTTNRNEVLDLGPGTEEIILDAILARGRGGASIIREGYPLGAFYTFVYEGIWQSQEEIDRVGTMPDAEPGFARFQDVNGDGVFNGQDLKIIPTGYPDFTYGLTNSFSYKGVDLSVFIQGNYGNEIMNLGNVNLRNPSGNNNILKEAANYWTPDNPDATIPRPRLNYTGSVSTRDLEDGSYLRVKNVTLGYSLPTGVLSVSGVREARLYVQARNLLTLTGYSGLDPEINIFGGETGRVGYDYFERYPASRTFSAGVNLTF